MPARDLRPPAPSGQPPRVSGAPTPEAPSEAWLQGVAARIERVERGTRARGSQDAGDEPSPSVVYIEGSGAEDSPGQDEDQGSSDPSPDTLGRLLSAALG